MRAVDPLSDNETFMLDHLQLSDVEQMIRLLAEASDPTIDTPLIERKRLLVLGLAKLIAADVWIWSTTRFNPAVPGDLATISLVHGGWRDDAEQVAFARLVTEPDTALPMQAPIIRLAQTGQPATVDIQTLFSEPMWDRIGQTYFATGLRHCLISVYPISSDIYSALGFHRRDVQSPFSDRERLIVHALVQQVDWLHRHDTDVEARDSVLELSPRERQVMIFLLGGDSREGIAEKLSLSPHTIGDYIKGIYKRLGVNGRAELMAKFVSGGSH